MNYWKKIIIFIVFYAFTSSQAQIVSLQGVSGSKALIAVNQGQPRFIREGNSIEGVLLEKINSDSSVIVKTANDRFVLRIGDTRWDAKNNASTPQQNNSLVGNVDNKNTQPQAAAVATQNSNSPVVTIPISTHGQFIHPGTINGQPVTFLLDTGATVVSMGITQALRLGINYQQGRQVDSITAGGKVKGYVVTLPNVGIGGIILNNVEAIVLSTDIAKKDFILLGMSFLSRTKMTWDKRQVTISPN